MFKETKISTYPSAEPDFLKLEVVQKQTLAGGIYLFELRHPDGSDLPSFTAGAHLTVEVPSGVRRNYSLCSNLAVSVPRNNFELHPRAVRFLFVAGGIGITPVLSMMRHLKSQGNDNFKLIYCTRDAASTAFLDELSGPEFAPHVQIHHDHGDINQAFDFWPVFESPGNAHVYCCGPRGLMDAVADMSGHWSPSAIHFESFGVDASTYAANTAFTVRLQKSGEVIGVGAEQSILEALRACGHHVTSSCESGTCGSCRTGLLGGEVEHRDMVLSDDEKASNIMVCVSRAKSPEPSAELVLDL
jgi:phthalate 4,5-dioxygenase reductase subunit